MTDINRIIVVGRLTRDIGNNPRDWAYTPNGTAKANVTIAVNQSKKEGEHWVDEASFFDAQIWGKLAESVKPYLTKGQQVAIDGKLKQERWQKDGKSFSRVFIVAESVYIIGKTKKDEEYIKNSTSYPQPTNDMPNDNDVPF